MYDLKQETQRRIRAANLSVWKGVHAATHAVFTVLPLFLSGLTNDIMSRCAYDEPTTDACPVSVVLFDTRQLGTGAALAAYRHWDKIAAMALTVVSECPCLGGCPLCIHSYRCGELNKGVCKASALRILKAIVDAAAAAAASTASSSTGSPAAAGLGAAEACGGGGDIVCGEEAAVGEQGGRASAAAVSAGLPPVEATRYPWELSGST
eukprot:GHVU01006351.1.p1 GENE.GHVU01006351.1~~GHVU01006351.1.p1  ORF type:complete len:208 (-),score=37.60 GHVU01006351.1:162-785(-)